MKKLLFLAATAALALSSCSSEEEVATAGSQQAVQLEGYVGRTTRATHDLNEAKLKVDGFGVYAYEQGTQDIETYIASHIAPNFFMNEKVDYGNGTSWEYYGNKKYWPNGEGQMLSFFAYAPYDASITTAPGSNPRLILDTRYNGPALYYKISENLTEVTDLCWGADAGVTKAPVNKTKPSINERTQFNFKHALARYGFNIQVFNDELTDTEDNCNIPATPLNPGTTIKINSLKLVGNMATEGVLQLYNGEWNAEVGLTKTYNLTNQFHANVADGITGNEAINEIPLLADANTYLMVIPGAKFKIELDYDVVTEDPNMPFNNNKVIVNNVVTSDAIFEAKAGVSTVFHLNVGLTTAKFTATIEDWVNNTVNPEVDLPNNFYNVTTVPFTVLNVGEYGVTANIPTTSAAGDKYLDTVALEFLVSDGTDFTKDTTVNGIFSTTGGIYQVTAGVAVMLLVNTNVTDVEALKTSPAGYYLIGTTLYLVD